MNDDVPAPSDPHDPADGSSALPPSWLGRPRKRIASREVSATAAAVEREMRDAALGKLAPADVIDAPARRSEAVLDPTLYSERHRKRGQNATYRLTQFCALVTLLASLIAIVVALLDDPFVARVLAGAACATAILSVYLVRRSRLAYRLRGYAAAVCVLALIALLVSVLPLGPHEENKAQPTPPQAPAPRP